jgi:hypothetical protein
VGWGAYAKQTRLWLISHSSGGKTELEQHVTYNPLTAHNCHHCGYRRVGVGPPPELRHTAHTKIRQTDFNRRPGRREGSSWGGGIYRLTGSTPAASPPTILCVYPTYSHRGAPVSPFSLALSPPSLPTGRAGINSEVANFRQAGTAISLLYRLLVPKRASTRDI